MLCCLNPDCQKPQNPDGAKFCQNCRTELVLLGGHYRVIQLLSDEGGFGRTYLAEDEQKLNELCVVKQLVPQLQETSGIGKAVELFGEEAKRLQQLGEHLQIPTLYAYFSQDNYFYLVQQYIEGQNLSQELRQKGALSERQIRELLLDILPVLKFIHERQVIHRDIKPQNIMRRNSLPAIGKGKLGELVLIDFGASKQLKATVKTKIATRIGSEGYSPMEQMRGGEAHPASDLFSLGVTCFHLLTQQHPFDLWTEHGYAWVQNWRLCLKSSVSNELGYVLDKLLQKDIERRYQSADEVIGDLITKPVAPLPPQSLVQNTQQPSQSLVRNSQQSPQFLVRNTQQPSQSLVRNSQQSPRFVVKNSRQQPRFLYSPPLRKKDSLSRNKLLVGCVSLLLALAVYSYLQFPQLPSDSNGDVTVSPIETSPWEKVVVANTLTGHLSWISSVVISPNGETLASGSWDSTIKVWNLKTGQEIRTLTGHSASVNSVAISPDGKTLASGSEDSTIKVWNLKTGQEIRTLIGHSSPVYSIAISPDGETLASGSLDSTIKVWNLKTGHEIRTLTGHLSSVSSVAISPDGETLASGSYDNTVKLWNLKNGYKIRTMTGHSNWIFSVAFSPDGKTLASGSWDRTIKLWSLKNEQDVHTLIGNSDRIHAVAFSPDGEKLVSGSLDSTIKVWSLKTEQEIFTLTGHSSSVSSVAFSRDGKTLVSGSWDNTIKIWRAP